MARSRNPDVELFVGTSGYSYPDWKGIVYPRSLKREVGGTTPELTYLSRYFNQLRNEPTEELIRNLYPLTALNLLE